jgi:hypothetical protein
VFSVLAHYGFDAERYINQVQLDDNVARQEAVLDLRYRPRPRMLMQLDGSFLDTQTPRELNTASLIGAGRAHAQRTRGRGGLVYDASPVTKITTDYEIANDLLEGGLASLTQTSRFGLAYRATPRTSFRTNSRYVHTEFRDASTIDSIAVTGGWAREMTPFITVELDAGPRWSSGALRPELSALVRRRLRRGEYTIQYMITEDTAFGEVGTIQVNRLMSTVSYTPTRAVTITALPAAVRNVRDSEPVTVYAVDADVTIRANTKLSFVGAGHFGKQFGTFNGIDDVIPYRGVSFRTVVTLQ